MVVLLIGEDIFDMSRVTDQQTATENCSRNPTEMWEWYSQEALHLSCTNKQQFLLRSVGSQQSVDGMRMRIDQPKL